MTKLSKITKSKKQTLRKLQYKTRSIPLTQMDGGSVQIAHNFKKYKMTGGAGRVVKQWQDMPEFNKVNNENEKMMQLSSLYETPQHDVYYKELDMLLQYSNYEINMDFINNFYRHIFYDTEEQYAIDLRKEKKQWHKPGEKIKYEISNYHVNPTHQNTTIVFLKNKDPKDNLQKVIKIFNNIDCDINRIREFLGLEITHISDKSRNTLSQYNYIHYENLNTFNKFNFNGKKYYIPEISGDSKSKVYLSCRNSDPINEYIINLIIGFINKNEQKNINYVHYDNLFVTTIYSDRYPSGKQCWCLLMDKVDGSLDSLIKAKETYLSNDTLLNYLKQAESLLAPLKTADYLFTHTDMKLENLFYKKSHVSNNNASKIDLYLADFDKSSITFRGIRFYNDIRENPNLKIAGVPITDPVQGYSTIFKGDSYIEETFPLRSIAAAGNEQHSYRISRIGRINNPLNTEFEEFYMRYNNQPFYTSFDIISLWLSILHFRRDSSAIINFKSIKTSELVGFLKNYMTLETVNLLTDFYSGLKYNYDGNFGLLLQPIFDREQAQLEQIKFLHKYDETEPKLIKGLYLTSFNKIALSLPFVPTSITVKNDITSFKPNKTATEKYEFYKNNKNTHVADFINALDNENILTIIYTSDYSISAEKGALLPSIIHSKPPAYIIKTNRYSNILYYYEWDIMLDIKDDLPNLIRLFNDLSKETHNEIHKKKTKSEASA